MSVVSVYAIFANADEATRIGRQVVEERLAACINILGPCRSIYRWRGRSRPPPGCRVLKNTDAWPTADARIAALHSYDVPGVLCGRSTSWRQLASGRGEVG